MPRKPPGFFITGSDTGVGKTYVAALMARALRAQGAAVGVYKPVASGCREERGELICDDAEALWQAAGQPGELARVCPQMFCAPLAPHLAAAAEGRTVDAAMLRDGVSYWQQCSDVVLVEGAGGLMSPLTENEYNADLAYDLGYPLLVVVPNRIGAINQALMTWIAARTYRKPSRVVGIVLNQATAENANDPSAASNLREIEARTQGSVLAEISFGAKRWPGELPQVL